MLYPFTLFTTWIHECSHAVMVVLMGGSVASITIQPDTSGLTRSLMPAARVAQGLVASAGYLGASLVGCLLMTATRIEKRARPILWSIGAFMLLTVVFWMRNPFGALVVLAWGVTLLRPRAPRQRRHLPLRVERARDPGRAQRRLRHPRSCSS